MTLDPTLADKQRAEKAAALMGQRLLVQIRKAAYTPISRDYAVEVRVLEVSPSSAFVKLQDDHGRRYWVQTDAVVLFETLAQKLQTPKADA